MYFAIVLKNTILVFMIILIIYLILKNKIVELKELTPSKLKYGGSSSIALSDTKKIPDTITMPQFERTMTDGNMKELYDYVYSDNAEENLKQFYEKSDIDPKIVDKKNVDCNEGQLFSPNLDKKMCQSSIAKHHELLDKKQVKAHGIVDLPQSCINEPIASYENESSMSGGMLLGDLGGFDNNFSSNFETL